MSNVNNISHLEEKVETLSREVNILNAKVSAQTSSIEGLLAAWQASKATLAIIKWTASVAATLVALWTFFNGQGPGH